MSEQKMTCVAAGSAKDIWALDALTNIYKYNPGSKGWDVITKGDQGFLTQVSAAADGTVCGVNSSGDAFRYAGKPTWDHIPGPAGHKLSVVSAGSATDVWALDTLTNIYKYNPGSKGWDVITKGDQGFLTQVSAAADGTVCGVNSSGDAFRYAGKPTWDHIPGPAGHKLSDISVGSATDIWALDTLTNIYKYNPGSKGWDVITKGDQGFLKQVSAAADGTVCGVNGSGEVFRYVGKPTWEHIPGPSSSR